MSEGTLKRTALYGTHLKYGARMVPFAGWEMPVQYGTGVIAEHMAVRTGAGIFDVSHMGEIWCEGEEAPEALNYLLTNDFRDMDDGQARYSPVCNERGGVVDDVICYRYSGDRFLIVVNATNTEKDFSWFTGHNRFKAVFSNASPDFVQLALQGPLAEAILLKLVAEPDLPKGNYTFKEDRRIAGKSCMISRTGYTGEDGFEIYTAPADAVAVWESLMEAGKGAGLIPCGLGARDTLRLEAGMPLYGHEMDENITPREAGLGIFVRMDKGDFIGRAALEAAGAPVRRKVGLRVTGRGIIRENMDVYRDGRKIGVTKSGTKCPFIGEAVATALIDADARELGRKVEVDVRGRMVEAEMVKSQFYKRGEKR